MCKPTILIPMGDPAGIGPEIVVKALVSEKVKNQANCVVIGDKYANSQIVPLGFICMNLFLERGFILKAIIVKNIGDTEGKANQQVIWRYRAMSADYYVFKHEYIMVFKKEVKNKKRK